jgi:hypothetical protein
MAWAIIFRPYRTFKGKIADLWVIVWGLGHVHELKKLKECREAKSNSNKNRIYMILNGMINMILFRV